MGWEFLLFLLCPLMMIFMMKGHSHGGHKKDNDNNSHRHHHSLDDQRNAPIEGEKLKSFKINQLEGEIEFLKKQNEMLRQKGNNKTI